MQPDQLTILNEEQQHRLVDDIQDKIESRNKIVHSVYILSNLDKSWQRKMLMQQYEISKQIKANFFIFHLQESPIQYKHLDTLIIDKRLNVTDTKCKFALENTSKRLKDPKSYMKQIQKYREIGMTSVLDIAHVASSGLFSLIPNKQTNKRDLKIKLKQIIQFVKKYGHQFDALHLADQMNFGNGNDIHTLPFSQGTLFTFENMFTSIDLLDELLYQYNIVVLEFIDQSNMFKSAVIRYLKHELYINPDLISYYVKILRWYETGIQGDESFRLINYEAIAQQLIEICRQPQTKKIQMNSLMWRQYCIPHKVSQLLLIVELTSYFLINKIKLPWEQLTHPPIKYYEPEEDVVSRKEATKYIKKLIQLKIIKSDKQVFGSYLRGNKFIGDLDILIDKQDKDKVIKILHKHVKNLKQQSLNNNIQNTKQQDKQLISLQILNSAHSSLQLNEHSISGQLIGIGKQINTEEDLKYEAEYTIIRLLLDEMINIDIYFASKNNPAMELFLTGNKYFNIYMRRRANQLGYKLTNTQFFTINTNNEWIPMLVKKQSDIFKLLQLPLIAPKFRVFYNC